MACGMQAGGHLLLKWRGSSEVSEWPLGSFSSCWRNGGVHGRVALWFHPVKSRKSGSLPRPVPAPPPQLTCQCSWWGGRSRPRVTPTLISLWSLGRTPGFSSGDTCLAFAAWTGGGVFKSVHSSHFCLIRSPSSHDSLTFHSKHLGGAKPFLPHFA